MSNEWAPNLTRKDSGRKKVCGNEDREDGDGEDTRIYNEVLVLAYARHSRKFLDTSSTMNYRAPTPKSGNFVILAAAPETLVW